MNRCIRLFRMACAVGLLACHMTVAWAGAQREEALADAVRTALSAAVTLQAPPELVHVNEAQAQTFARWLPQAEARLAQQLRRRSASQAGSGPAHELDHVNLRREFLQTVWYESQRAGLEPSLVLGLIQVESGFRKFAISSAGARGYMQVMPFWPRMLIGGDGAELFQMQANLRFGCVILRHYLNQEQGDLVMALGRYNGSRGEMAYPNAVLAARRQWAL